MGVLYDAADGAKAEQKRYNSVLLISKEDRRRTCALLLVDNKYERKFVRRNLVGFVTRSGYNTVNRLQIGITK